MGSERLLEAEHIEFWLIDDGPAANPNLEFLVDDAARTIRTLRAEGKKVLVHCVEGSSRTPAQSNTAGVPSTFVNRISGIKNLSANPGSVSVNFPSENVTGDSCAAAPGIVTRAVASSSPSFTN